MKKNETQQKTKKKKKIQNKTKSMKLYNISMFCFTILVSEMKLID